jgi:hypothetical protein
MLSFEELDRLLDDAAADSGAAALAFSVHDEDSVYLSGADPDGVAFGLVLGAKEFDEQELGTKARTLVRGGSKGFAEWAARYAPEPVSGSAVRRFAQTADVVGLLAAAGLYPEPRQLEPWTHWYPAGFHGASDRTWTEILEGTREYVILHKPEVEFEGPPGPWIILLADGRFGGLTAALTFGSHDQVYYFESFRTFEAAKEHFGTNYYGRSVPEWQEVPGSVSRDRAATVAWLVDRANQQP